MSTPDTSKNTPEEGEFTLCLLYPDGVIEQSPRADGTTEGWTEFIQLIQEHVGPMAESGSDDLKKVYLSFIELMPIEVSEESTTRK